MHKLCGGERVSDFNKSGYWFDGTTYGMIC